MSQRTPPICKGYILYVSNYDSLERAKIRRQKIQGLLGFKGEGGMTRQSTDDSQGTETILYRTVNGGKLF